jgi:hypothetical protein
MGAGKYSPTTSYSYMTDQGWFAKNGGGFDNGDNPNSDDDNDGYDSYGYSAGGNGPDRAGHTELDYMQSYHTDDDGHYSHPLVDDIGSQWYGVFIPDHKWTATGVTRATKVINGAGFAGLSEDDQKTISALSEDQATLDLLAKAYSLGVINAWK